MTPWLLFPLVFCAAAVVAIPWALYTRSAGQDREWHAAFYDLMIYMLNPIATIGLIENRMSFVPTALGGAFGTFWSIRISKSRRTRRAESAFLDPGNGDVDLTVRDVQEGLGEPL